jgi:Zn-dependent oligopeptidase
MQVDIYCGPYKTPVFDFLKIEDFIPALEGLIQKSKLEIEEIISNSETPTFNNTVAALDFSGSELSEWTSLFFNLHSANTDDEMQKIAPQFSEKITEYRNYVMTNKALFERIKYVWDHRKKATLSTEQFTLLEKTFLSFSRNGALLNSADKEKLKKIDQELSETSLKFGEHVLNETNEFELRVVEASELTGLPEDVLNMAAEKAKDKNQAGYIFTLHFPSYVPFMKHCQNRQLRKQLYEGFVFRACKGDDRDNRKNIENLVKLRWKRAHLLGYKNHADYTLKRRMAGSEQAVNDFLADLMEKAKPAALKDLQLLKDRAVVDGIVDLKPWDIAYYTERLKEENFDLDESEIREYFTLDRVLETAFEVAKRLFGISFHQNHEISTYHKDVLVYDVLDEMSSLKAVLYLDFHPRSGKRQGAWMTSFRDQCKNHEENQIPLISVVCNFTPATSNKPSLLSFQEVTTLFHEFGHALHGILSDVSYPGISGTSVLWDFVELPSQLMENWCYEEDVLKLMAVHYKNGEPLPKNKIDKIIEQRSFFEGYQTLRQINFGVLDMAWHGNLPEPMDVDLFEKESTKKTTLIPVPENAVVSCQFSHIFQGGYSAGYYSYKWAEVLEADVFQAFKEKGIFNDEVSTSFKENILSKGGSEDPMELFKKFRNREPDPTILLRRSGLV